MVRWLVVSGGLLLALLVCPAPAQAVTVVVTDAPVNVTVDVDPNAGTVDVSVCWEHDSKKGPDFRLRNGVGAWVPQGTQDEDGSLHISAGDPSCEFDPVGSLTFAVGITIPTVPSEEVSPPVSEEGG